MWIQITCSIKINTLYKNVSKLKCKDFYNKFIQRIKTRPVSLYRWEEMYYFASLPWEELFTIPYKYTAETSIQSLQYQIIHRFFPCMYTLHIWQKADDPNCILCKNEQDTIEHYFYHCKTLKKLWVDFMTYFQNVFHTGFPLGVLDIIFGITNVYEEIS